MSWRAKLLSLRGIYSQLSPPFDRMTGGCCLRFVIQLCPGRRRNADFMSGLMLPALASFMLRQLEFVLMLAHHIASSLGYVWSQTPPPHSLLVWLQSMKLCVCFLGWWAVGELRLPKAPLFCTPSPYGWASQVRLEGKRKRSNRVGKDSEGEKIMKRIMGIKSRECAQNTISGCSHHKQTKQFNV